MLKDITLGQYFPGKTFLHRLDPRTKLILVIVFMFLTGPVLTHLIAAEEVASHQPTEDEYREEDRRWKS